MTTLSLRDAHDIAVNILRAPGEEVSLMRGKALDYLDLDKKTKEIRHHHRSYGKSLARLAATTPWRCA